MSRENIVPVLAIVLGATAALGVAWGLFHLPPKATFEVREAAAAPRESHGHAGMYEPQSNATYAEFSPAAKRAFRQALGAADQRITVTGERNVPDDLQYVTDHYPSPGVYDVSYRGDHYVMIARSSGVAIGYGISVLLVAFFGFATSLFGAAMLSVDRTSRFLALQTGIGTVLVALLVVDPRLFDGPAMLLAIGAACAAVLFPILDRLFARRLGGDDPA
ncbi:MAG: hypothetical protein ABEJ31_15255 [Haloarculaceae archaeon]